MAFRKANTLNMLISSGKYSVQELHDELARRTGVRILIFVTGNRRRMISVKRLEPGVFEVRLQGIFLSATAEVLDEIAGMITGRGTSRQAIQAFVDQRINDENSSLAYRAAQVKRPVQVEGKGEHHDLAGYAKELNLLYLGNRSTAQVAWGRKSKRKNIRSIRFACYDASRNMIIMNRKLDSPDIPRYFVEFVLFHEMLHEVLGIGEKPDGRRDIHGSIFKLMETTYPDYDKALRFEKQLCESLFGSANS
jgi:hypothetical protein